MDFQAAPGTIAWKVHFRSEPDAVYQALATDRGRSSFWAEQTVERNGEITFHFMSHPPTTGRLLAADPPSRFAVTYFGTETTFTLTDDGSGGTDHGHGTMMMVMGGGVRGGKVYGRWPGLSTGALYQGRDLAVTTDFRTVYAEVLHKHLGVANPKFPGGPPSGAALGLL